MEAVPALERLGHEGCEFDAGLDCIVSLKKQKENSSWNQDLLENTIRPLLG